jgi:hypothetical protein
MATLGARALRRTLNPYFLLTLSSQPDSARATLCALLPRVGSTNRQPQSIVVLTHLDCIALTASP